MISICLKSTFLAALLVLSPFSALAHPTTGGAYKSTDGVHKTADGAYTSVDGAYESANGAYKTSQLASRQVIFPSDGIACIPRQAPNLCYLRATQLHNSNIDLLFTVFDSQYRQLGAPTRGGLAGKIVPQFSVDSELPKTVEVMYLPQSSWNTLPNYIQYSDKGEFHMDVSAGTICKLNGNSDVKTCLIPFNC